MTQLVVVTTAGYSCESIITRPVFRNDSETENTLRPQFRARSSAHQVVVKDLRAKLEAACAVPKSRGEMRKQRLGGSSLSRQRSGWSKSAALVSRPAL